VRESALGSCSGILCANPSNARTSFQSAFVAERNFATVEANFSATLLMNYDVLFDYKARTMTLAAPGTVQHEGVRVPGCVNPKTGLVSIEITVGSSEGKAGLQGKHLWPH